jgi:putative metallohydrolase (TIGR04338 family)
MGLAGSTPVPSAKIMDDSAAYRSEDILPEGVRLADLAEVGDYVIKLMRQSWFQRKWPHVKVVLLYGDDMGAASGSAHQGIGWIRLAPNCRCEKTILHEMAHVVNSGGGHDAEFRRNLVILVGRMMGLGKELRQSYKKNLESCG